MEKYFNWQVDEICNLCNVANLLIQSLRKSDMLIRYRVVYVQRYSSRAYLSTLYGLYYVSECVVEVELACRSCTYK